MSVEQARGRAHEINARIAKGENPANDRRKVFSRTTVMQLFDIYLEDHAKPKKKSWREDVAQFRRYGKPLHRRRLRDLQRHEIQRLHIRIGRQNGHYAANRFLALLHTIFNKAIEWGWEATNPASRIEKFKEQPRDRFLTPREIGAFFKALDEEQNETARDFFWVCLLTGARRSNVSAMRWEQMSFEDALWTIPDTKNGTPHRVPLVPRALDILAERYRERYGPWVFPGRGQKGHLVDPTRAWRRVTERAQLPDVRIHDLRRTLGSWLAASGTSLAIIGKTLGHKSPQATSIYARLGTEPVAASMIAVTERMLASQIDPPPRRLTDSQQAPRITY
jgi:integrase